MQRQQFIQEFIAHTSRNIFLTGKAGTGKTTLLHHIRTSTYKNCVVAAPTGIAALNAGGVTLHSLLQLPIGAYVPDSSLQLSTSQSQLFVTPKDFRRHIRLQERKIRLLRAIELLVIDEVSMLRADTLDLVDMLLRSVRRNPLPFGGVQVLFIGDLLQLPPVVKPQEWAVLSQYYASPFFFHAHVLRNHPPLYIELTHVYRQEDSEFLGLLNNLRYNRVTPADRAWLESRIDPHFDPIHNDGYVTLTTHNQRADEINQRALDALPGAPQSYHARISGDWRTISSDVLLDDPSAAIFINRLIMIAYGVAIAPYRMLKMHASVTVLNGEALLFLGVSGTGKSTHSRLWRKYVPGATLLNDDEPIVRVLEDGEVRVYGCPWSGSTPCYKNESARVKAFVYLYQAPENKLTRLRGRDSFDAIYSSSAFLHSDKVRHLAMFDTVADILELIPVYRLDCEPNEGAVALTRQLLEK